LVNAPIKSAKERWNIELCGKIFPKKKLHGSLRKIWYFFQKSALKLIIGLGKNKFLCSRVIYHLMNTKFIKRKCPETIEAYERGQSIGHNENKKNSKEKEQHSDSDNEEDAADNLTMRNKTIKRGKHNVERSMDDKKMKEKKRVLPTMRARESTPNKKV
jgi:hypothetical protein